MSTLTETTSASAAVTAAPAREWRPPSYWPFVIPALVVVLAVIIFPWLFTISQVICVFRLKGKH